MSTDFQYKSRLNLLRSMVERLETGEREIIKSNVRQLMERVSTEAFDRMRAMTPVRDDEDEDMYQHRVEAIGRYGKPTYVKEMSPNRSVRLYGMNLKSGWEMPKVDFIGSSGGGRVRVSTTISNRAEHAKMVLTGNYSNATWEITDNVPLQGGRKALAFMRGSHTVFVRPESISFPVKFRAGTSVAALGIPQAGQNIINSYRDEFMKVVRESIIEEARVTFI